MKRASVSTRRQFLRRTGIVLATVPTGLVAACHDKTKKGDDHGDGGTEDVQSIDLTVQWLDATFDGKQVRLRSYGLGGVGTVPGPLIRTRPGQTLAITLTNHLDDYSAKPWTHADRWQPGDNHNIPHRLSTTNLHLHGLDIVPHLFEPVGTSDPKAAMIAVAPEGSTYDYTFELPDDHPCGLFWYHPHHHGSTVVQAVSGMAGPIIVEGPIDEVPEIAAAKEYLVAIQDIGLFPSDDPDTPDLWVYEPVQNTIWQTFEDQQVTLYDPKSEQRVPQPDLRGGFTTGDYKLRFYLVNGEPFYREDHNDTMAACPQSEPPLEPAPSPYTCPIGAQLNEGLQLSAAPGEVFRLRILNGCSDLCMPLHLEGHAIHLIALDGVNFEKPRTITTRDAVSWDGKVDYSEDATSLVLAPANRAELLVKAGEPGTYELVQLTQVGEQFLAADRKVIATLTVSGDAVDMALPKELPVQKRNYPLIKDSEIVDDSYRVDFSMAFEGPLNPVVGLDFMIGGEIYQEEKVQKEVKLGTAEQWTLRSMMTSEGHPFHVHVNPFEVLSIAGVKQPPGTIMDTVWVPKPPNPDKPDEDNPGVVIRTRFRTWTGKSVYHCHILPHEDAGMMRNFLIKA